MSARPYLCMNASSIRTVGAKGKQSWSHCACGLLDRNHGNHENSRHHQISFPFLCQSSCYLALPLNSLPTLWSLHGLTPSPKSTHASSRAP